jgi:hypothetical protein
MGGGTAKTTWVAATGLIAFSIVLSSSACSSCQHSAGTPEAKGRRFNRKEKHPLEVK